MSVGANEWDFVVPSDGGELLAELRRHGITPGQRVHLYAVHTAPSEDRDPLDVAAEDDLDTALQVAAAAKTPPFRSAKGMLAGSGPAPEWADFEDASRLAASDTEPGSTLSQ